VYDKGRQKDIQGGGVARHLDIQHLANVSLLCRVIMSSAVLEVTWVRFLNVKLTFRKNLVSQPLLTENSKLEVKLTVELISPLD